MLLNRTDCVVVNKTLPNGEVLNNYLTPLYYYIRKNRYYDTFPTQKTADGTTFEWDKYSTDQYVSSVYIQFITPEIQQNYTDFSESGRCNMFPEQTVWYGTYNPEAIEQYEDAAAAIQKCRSLKDGIMNLYDSSNSTKMHEFDTFSYAEQRFDSDVFAEGTGFNFVYKVNLTQDPFPEFNVIDPLELNPYDIRFARGESFTERHHLAYSISNALFTIQGRQFFATSYPTLCSSGAAYLDNTYREEIQEPQFGRDITIFFGEACTMPDYKNLGPFDVITGGAIQSTGNNGHMGFYVGVQIMRVWIKIGDNV